MNKKYVNHYKKPVVFMGLPLILIMIVVTFVPVVYAAGDIDGNGTVDLKDAVLSLQICAGSASTGVHSDEDINNDQKIGMEEAVYILTVYYTKDIGNLEEK